MAVTSLMNDRWNWDENFGMGLDFNALKRQFREWIGNQSHSYASTIGNDSQATVTTNDDKFQVTIDVHQFKSEEIIIKVVSNTISIEAKHEEQHQDCGFISRHFLRKYTLPNGYDINNVVSSLSSDGILRIIAPRSGQTIDEYRNIPIQQTNTSVQSKKQIQEVHTQHKNSTVQNQQRNEVQVNRKENDLGMYQTKHFEETHNYIQQFLADIDNKYKVVPIKQVGPFSKLNKAQIETTNNNLQQKHYQKVPMRQTSENYSSVTGSNQVDTAMHTHRRYTVPINQTEQITEENVEHKMQNHKFNSDRNETRTQDEIQFEYRTVPIQQTKKTSEYDKSSFESTNTNIYKSNMSQEYKTIPIEHTGVQAKRNDTKIWENEQIHDSHKHRIVPIEQTEAFAHETHKEKISNSSSIDSQLKNLTDFEQTESREYNTQRKIANTSQTIPIDIIESRVRQEELNKEHTRLVEAYNKSEEKPLQLTEIVSHKSYEKQILKNDSIDSQIENKECYSNKTQNFTDTSGYRTIPIEQTGMQNRTCEQQIFKTDSIDSQQSNKNRNFNKEENWDYTSQRTNANVPIEQTKSHIRQEELKETKQIRQNIPIQTAIASQETYEQQIFKNNLINSQQNCEATESHTNKIQNFANTSEYRTVPIEQTGTYKQRITDSQQYIKDVTNSNRDETQRTNVSQPYNIPNEQTSYIQQELTKTDKRDERRVFEATIPSQTEILSQRISKNNFIDSQQHFETTKSRECQTNTAQNVSSTHEYRTVPIQQTSTVSQITKNETHEQMFKTNSFDKQNGTNFESVNDSQQNVLSASCGSKTFPSGQKSQHELHENSKTIQQEIEVTSESSQSTPTKTTQTSESNEKCSKYIHDQQNQSSLQSNTNHTDDEQNIIAFHESDYIKEDSVHDGYRQSAFTNKNAKSEYVTLPQGFKVSNKQAYYSEQRKTKECDSKNGQVNQAANNAYQVQFSVESNNSEQYCRRPSETSEICIEEITEENEKTCRGGTSGFRKHETSQIVSNSDRSVHIEGN